MTNLTNSNFATHTRKKTSGSQGKCISALEFSLNNYCSLRADPLFPSSRGKKGICETTPTFVTTVCTLPLFYVRYSISQFHLVPVTWGIEPEIWGCGLSTSVAYSIRYTSFYGNFCNISFKFFALLFLVFIR